MTNLTYDEKVIREKLLGTAAVKREQNTGKADTSQLDGWSNTV